MTKSEINIKIKELEKKLNSKIKVNGRKKKKKISIHLRQYYLKEIEKLKILNGEIKKIDIDNISKKKTKQVIRISNSVRTIYTPMGNKR